MSVIADIDVDDGTFDEFDSTTTDGGDLSVAVAAALASTVEGISCLIDDTTSIYAEDNYTQLGTRSDCRYRFYIDPNGLTMDDSTNHQVLRFLSGTSMRSQVSLGFTTGGGFRIRGSIRNDAGTTINGDWENISDAEHYVEVLARYATGESADDGILRVWIDGSQVNELTNVDLFTRDSSDTLRIGAASGVDSGTSGTQYIDQLVMNDDGSEIGAHSAGISIPIVQHHRRMQGVFQ